MLHTNTPTGEVDEVLKNCLESSEHITIACGYFGHSQLKQYESHFIDKIKAGGSVKLLHGLGMWEGISSNLNSTIDSINNQMTSITSLHESGVFFATERRYHGKIYRFSSAASDKLLIGSSNFSHQGNFLNLEANILSDDTSIINKVDIFLKGLKTYAVPFKNGIIPIKGRAAHKSVMTPHIGPDGFTPPINILLQPVSFTLPIRTNPNSSFNLTFGKGRFVRKRNIYAIRPYYEVEITLPQKYWIHPLTNYVANSPKDIVEFQAFTDNGMYFPCNFNRKTTGSKDERPLHETGGDFQSTPRELLGRFVKDKLINSGAMNYGDPITDDVLNDYGTKKINVRKMKGNRLHLEF